MVLLLRKLHPHGLRWFADELSHASGWGGGRLRPGTPRRSTSVGNENEQTYLNGLREFNATLPSSERIRFRYIDMNHNEAAFQTSLQMMNLETDLSSVATILALDPYGEDYLEALHVLERATRSPTATGSAFEAGTAVALRHHAGDLYAIAFFGMHGERIRHSRDQNPQPMRPMAELPARNLSRRIADAAAAASAGDGEIAAVFLPLDHPAFKRRMPVSYGSSPVRVVPARQFDAFVVYPYASVLRSLQATWYTAP